MLKSLLNTPILHRFTYEEKGAVLPLVGLSMLALTAAVGVAIDVERAQQVQSKLSSALDAAGLAAGATVNTADIQSEASKYMNANFRNHMGATISNLVATPNADNTIISLSATATVDTAFMKIFGYNTVTVSADSEITRESKGLELVMVLDNTGSMSGSKLASLKTAATDMINILYGNNITVPNLWVGLVPFSQTVNIGSSRTSWTNADTYLWGPEPWDGCVDARSSGEDVTDTPPASEPFRKYYWGCHTSHNAWYGTNWNRDNCSTSGTVRYRSNLGAYRGPNKYCPQQVTPMTANKGTITDAIDDMEAVGLTHINLGAAWGWRMLSPRWRGLWGGEMNAANLPLDYNTQNMNKAIIIMTDGDHTMSNSANTAYGYLNQGVLGTTHRGTAENRLDDRLSQVCTSMKNENVIVYTVSFGSISTSSQTMLRNCASQVDFYFNSPSSADLQQAFRAIGDSLASLRVSK